MALLCRSLFGQKVPNPRNLQWNQIVYKFDENNKTFLQIQDFYHEHAGDERIGFVDYRVNKLIDRCITELGELVRMLKELKRL